MPNTIVNANIVRDNLHHVFFFLSLIAFCVWCRLAIAAVLLGNLALERLSAHDAYKLSLRALIALQIIADKTTSN